VTAYHVVEGAQLLVLAKDGKRVGVAEIALSDPVNDVAILRPSLTDGTHKSINVRMTPPQLGEKVFTLGYPAPSDLGLSLKMTSGEISSLAGQDVVTGNTDDVRLVQVSIPIQSGNSGGPVLDDSGDAIAMIVSKKQLTSGNEIAQNVNYAIKISYVSALILSLPELGSALAPDAHSTTDAVRDRKDSVFLIINSKSPN